MMQQRIKDERDKSTIQASRYAGAGQCWVATGGNRWQQTRPMLTQSCASSFLV